MNPKVVEERPGHHDIGMTLNRYARVTPDMQQEAARKLSDLLFG